MISQSKIEDKRERILIAARRLFVEQGIQHTATASIAREAGVANGTLFHYFKTKKDLINALREDITRSFFIVTTAGIENEKTTKRKIRLWCSNTIKWALNRPHDYLFLQQCSITPNCTGESMEGISKHMLFCYDLIDQGKEEKILKDIPTEMLYQLVTYQLHGTINFLMQQNESQQYNFFINKAFDICWNSISEK